MNPLTFRHSDGPISPGSFKGFCFNGKFKKEALSHRLNNITHSATLGLKGHYTPLHSTIARTTGGLLGVRNCIRKNKQTLDPIWGKKEFFIKPRRLENLRSPLTFHSHCWLRVYYLPRRAPLSLFLPSLSVEPLLLLSFPSPLPVAEVIFSFHLGSFPPLCVTHVYSDLGVCVKDSNLRTYASAESRKQCHRHGETQVLSTWWHLCH